MVSIITPVYNSEKFIGETIASVRAQSHKDWEMLVLIDHGSKDRTADIVREIQAQDPRVQLVSVPNGRSVVDARNHGFKVARGRYIAFLDADDLWMPRKLEVQLQAMQAKQSPLSCTAFRRISESGNEVGRLIEVPTEITYQDLLIENRMACLTVMWDREKLGEPKMRDEKHEDLALWLSALRAGRSALGINEDLGRYRIVGGSRSSSKLRAASWRWHIYREEGFGPIRSAYYLSRYAMSSLKKYARF
ncbi:MAG TPA: glycosyltransferase family 2 protein [Pseudobdellovibrionaceae bacterium]|nr:glycosyltransferase family 2 protein [Pseudobdellovibrionaceae bacterium]